MKKVTVDGALYFRAIRNLRRCVSDSEFRQELTSISFAVRGNQLHLYALDGYQGQKIILPLQDNFSDVEDFRGIIDPIVPVPNPSRRKVLFPVSLELNGDVLHISYFDAGYTVRYDIAQNKEPYFILDSVLASRETTKTIKFSTALLSKAIAACRGSTTVLLELCGSDNSIKLTGQYGSDESATFSGIILPIRS